uniref:BCAS3 domain-containing protein n=1 Tax=Mesocestoides corti TaxID=53468 RepID=A0A5K3FWG1_MESCO
MSALRMAASFQSPVCCIPVQQGRTPSGSQFKRPDIRGIRYSESLFVLTWDMHLVEYELLIAPTGSDEKVGQDSPIKACCSPLGQWRLRTDTALCVPPFPSNHPLLTLLRPPPPPPLPSSVSVAAIPHRHPSPLPVEESPLDTLPESTTLSTAAIDVPEKQGNSFDDVTSCLTGSVKSCRSMTAAPEGWPKDDASSYWYSQVELTTHLGPLRRIWMGPQFTFRSYPFDV